MWPERRPSWARTRSDRTGTDPGAEQAGAGQTAIDAELISSREILPGRWLQTYRAPHLASAARPGQYLHVITPRGWGIPLRRPVTIHGVERARGEITIHLAPREPATPWLSAMRPADRVALLGPLGRPVRMEARTHHLLLIAEGSSIAALRPLADDALATGRSVALLLGAPRAADVYPSTLLPDEVEYVVATDDGSFGHHGSVADLVPGYEAWADQAVAAGPASLLADLVHLAAGRHDRLGVARLGRRTGRSFRGGARSTRVPWLQVMLPQRVGCALGVCLGCVVRGSKDQVRVCREGPAFGADELAWDAQG